MRITKRTPLRNVALMVGDALRRHGIRAILTGGACAAVYSEGSYTSYDLDYVLEGQVHQADLDAALQTLEFRRKGDRYVHTRSEFWVEFPRGPLAVGREHDLRPAVLRGSVGRTLALSATDSCRDRLAAFYHWADRQSFRAAVEIAVRQRVSFNAIEAWSGREGHPEEYAEFRREVERVKKTRRKSRRRPPEAR